MVQVLPEVPSFGTLFARNLGTGFSKGVGSQLDLANKLKLEEGKKRSMKDAIENEKFSTGLETLRAMKAIAEKKNIGRGSSVLGFFPGETAKDRAEFEQLGKSLIPLVAAGVPIRNQKEFEEYKKVITDPSSPLSAIEGAISGLERIFEQKLSGEGIASEKKGKQRFDPNNPEHKAKASQLYKTYRDKEKVREALRREFEGL